MGTYRGNLIAQDNQDMPFMFEVTSSSTLKIYNADEIIEVDEIVYISLRLKYYYLCRL